METAVPAQLNKALVGLVGQIFDEADAMKILENGRYRIARLISLVSRSHTD